MRCTAARLVVASVIAAERGRVQPGSHGYDRPVPTAVAVDPRRAEAFLDTLQQRTFQWFWDTTDPRTGLTPDRWPARTFSSVAAIGFALTAYPIGAERGYVTRAAAAERTLSTLRFLWQLPQGETATGRRGIQGLLLPLPRLRERAPLRDRSSSPRSTRRCCWPACCSASRTSPARSKPKSRCAPTPTRCTAASTGRGRGTGRRP